MPPGPPPKPIEMKLLEGNPGKRKLNKNAPMPERIISLKCPKFIGKYGRQEWQRITSDLSRLNMLTGVDQGALEMYCQTYQKWRDAEDYLIKEGTVYAIKDDYGNIKCVQQVPQVSIAHQSAEYCRKMLSEFGLTPAARTRLSIPASEVRSAKDLAFERLLD